MKRATFRMKFVKGLPVLQPVGTVANTIAELMRVQEFDLARIRRLQLLGFKIELLDAHCSVGQ